MKKFLKLNRGIFRILCAFVLCATIIVVVAKCDDTETKCKTCTNTQKNETRIFCGDDLKDAEELPHMKCE